MKNELNIPVIGNGDVTSAKIGFDRLKNLDGIMIGRAALTNPWIFKQLRALLEGKEMPPKPTMEDQVDFFQRHADFATEFKSEKWAMIEMRKHFAHFLRGFHGASKFRDRLIRVENRKELELIFEEILVVNNDQSNK